MQELKETASEFLNIYSADNIERCYEELSEYSAEALESLQYLSHAYYLSAAVCDENEKNELLQEAIRVSDEVIVARSIVLGPCHRKTLESMRYGAEYYHQCGNRDDAQKRMQYAVDYLNDGQVSKSQIAEYETLLNKIKISQ